MSEPTKPIEGFFQGVMAIPNILSRTIEAAPGIIVLAEQLYKLAFYIFEGRERDSVDLVDKP